MSRERALACIPIKNPEVEDSRDANKDLLLTYPVRTKPAFAALARFATRRKDMPRLTRKLQLDALGTSVWELIDGKRSVRGIVRSFARNHKLEQRESEVAVTRFIRELGKRGLVGLKEGPIQNDN